MKFLFQLWLTNETVTTGETANEKYHVMSNLVRLQPKALRTSEHDPECTKN